MNVLGLTIAALRIMGVGFTMVFAVLAIFFGLVKALMFVFPSNSSDD